MLILAFESSAKPASAALVKDGQLLSQYMQCSALTHSRTLLPMAEDMLKNAELKLSDIDLIAVAHGPGSFTGIRIGVSTVKGLAWAAEKPCVGVSTLEAMAWHGLAAGGYICPVMDARRSQVYNAIFKIENGRPVRMTEDRPIALEELAEEVTALGAPVCAMKIIEAKMEKELRNDVNRRCNCDTANLGKAVNAAQQQIAAIRQLRKSGKLDELPEKLKSAAILREENPEATLSELAAMADPPLSKPAMSHRMRKLIELSTEG